MMSFRNKLWVQVLDIICKVNKYCSFCASLTKIVTSQVGLVFIQYLNVPCNSNIIGQNQVKFGTLIKQDGKTRKIHIFAAIEIC